MQDGECRRLACREGAADDVDLIAPSHALHLPPVGPDRLREGLQPHLGDFGLTGVERNDCCVDKREQLSERRPA